MDLCPYKNKVTVMGTLPDFKADPLYLEPLLLRSSLLRMEGFLTTPRLYSIIIGPLFSIARTVSTNSRFKIHFLRLASSCAVFRTFLICLPFSSTSASSSRSFSEKSCSLFDPAKKLAQICFLDFV